MKNFIKKILLKLNLECPECGQWGTDCTCGDNTPGWGDL